MMERRTRWAQAIGMTYVSLSILRHALHNSDPTYAAWSGVMAGAFGATAIWAALQLRRTTRS